MKIVTLEDVFLYNLADIYNAEKQLAKTLPKLARAAKNERLSECFETQQNETEAQIERISYIIESQQLKLPRTKCKMMEALAEETILAISNVRLSSVRDVMLIANAEKIQHYAIASYSCLAEMADKLQFDKAAKFLTDALREEMAMNTALKKIVIATDGEALRIAA